MANVGWDMECRTHQALLPGPQAEVAVLESYGLSMFTWGVLVMTWKYSCMLVEEHVEGVYSTFYVVSGDGRNPAYPSQENG